MPARPRVIGVESLNAINIGLMLVSAAVAWVIPFELLLVAYAVLGPLHYLTEISWLHDRGYFTTRRYDYLALLALGALGALEYVEVVQWWDGWAVLAFGLAAVFALSADPRRKAILAACVVAASLALQGWTGGWLFLIIMLPTVIHVFCFTGLFILHGSIKSRSPTGYASFAVFLVCAAALLLYHPPAQAYHVSDWTATLVDELRFPFDQLAAISGESNDAWSTVVALGRFLAFIYTYHYLNWFSKTRIIRWHEVSGARLAAIAVAYAGALGLFAYDYVIGLQALFGLSFLHVLLEFPLDVRTIVALGGRRIAT